ncbi:MAG: Uma2 family endonuclease [Bernardetiaceae bacterium]|nr:Uma2 family endonuclease [Bernardetiaceae bacterium]
MAVISSFSQLNPEGIYTYADYLQWQLSEYVELIKGKIFRMSPAPSTQHQSVVRELMRSLLSYFKKNSPCSIFSAPFDVRLPEKKRATGDEDIYTVVQPDICVICNLSKIDERGCIGAPDLVVEVISPSTSYKDLKVKYALYEENGVGEYWAVLPGECTLLQFVLNQAGKFELKGIFAGQDSFSSHLFPDLQISLSDVFQQ